MHLIFDAVSFSVRTHHAWYVLIVCVHTHAQNGGALSIYSSPVTFVRCNFWGNNAIGSVSLYTSHPTYLPHKSLVKIKQALIVLASTNKYVLPYTIFSLGVCFTCRLIVALHRLACRVEAVLMGVAILSSIGVRSSTTPPMGPKEGYVWLVNSYCTEEMRGYIYQICMSM